MGQVSEASDQSSLSTAVAGGVRAWTGVPAASEAATVKLSTRVKGPPGIEVSVTRANPFQAAQIVQEIFDGLRHKYGTASSEDE